MSKGHLRIVLNGTPVEIGPLASSIPTTADLDWRDTPRRTPREASRKEQDETRLRKLLRIDRVNPDGTFLDELLEVAIKEIREFQFAEAELGSDQWRLLGMIVERLETAQALELLRIGKQVRA